VSDPDVGGHPLRKPYARPETDAQTDARGFVVEPPPNASADRPLRPAAGVEGSMAASSITPSKTGGRAGGALRGSVADADPVGIDEARPRAVQVAVARRGPRRARLVVKHIDPWTVMKVSFVVSLVMLAVCVIAVAVIYAVLGKMGVWTQINTLVNEVSPTTTSKALRNPLSGSRVVGIAAVIGAINVVLLTALSTLGAAIYNLISDLVGGVEVTLTDP
jgi:hypothetical protein